MKSKNLGALCLLAIAFVSVHAQNPIVQTHFSPDPAPMVHNGTVYVYTGDDIPGFDFYYMTKWRVISSTDMVNWTDYGSPIQLESFSWARDRAWAAQCIPRNGKFYWYICAQTVDNNMAIGVAVSDKPTGPFKDALGKPLITTGTWANIDPTVAIDDDGQAYLYWGNGGLFYVKLNKDMVSYAGDIVTVPQTLETFGGVRRPRNPNPPAAQSTEPVIANKDVYVEGPWFFKRNGKYYQMFAGMSKGGESLSYSLSDSATGPWKYQGKVMTEQATNSFTNHGGVIDYKGKSYLFYHTGLLPNGGSYGRATAIEEFTYNNDGTIPEIKMTKAGVVEPAANLNPYSRTEAETAAWSEKCKIGQDEKNSVFITDTRTGGFIKVRAVDFGKEIPKSFMASVAAGLDGGILEVRVDSAAGPLLAKINIPRTGGWQNWKQMTASIETPVTGVHDLYLTFKGQNITAGRTLFNVDYWKFSL